MPLQKLTSTDAFIVTDIPDAPATGPVRMARKILQSSASDMARSATYTFAAFELQRGGASAGINAEGDATGPALEAFVQEVTPLAAEGQVHFDPAKGIPEGGFDSLEQAGGRGSLAGSPRATTMSVLAATRWVLGDLDGRSVAIEGSGAVPAALETAFTEAGATIVTVDGVDKKPWLLWGAEADAVVCGSKLGALTHQGADFVKAKAIVPWGTAPVTTKAFAQLRRGGVAVLPDFVSAGGGLLAGYLEGTEDEVLATIASSVTAVLDQAGGHADGPLLGACYAAESFLASWTDTRLFGRPLAS